jgi:threonine/homoserine/homoserine lactone efflux protein
MTPWFLGLLGFAIAASVTPGPNNVLVAANAAQHGMRAAVPHAFGIAVGFSAMIVLVGLGLSGVLATITALATLLHWVAFAWLLVLAWQIAVAPPPGGANARRPFGFVEAILFQWINPKAWLLALSIASAWIRPEAPALPQLLLIGGVFFLVGPPSNLPWALLGTGAARYLATPSRLRAFNVVMAVLLVLSMLPVVFP